MSDEESGGLTIGCMTGALMIFGAVWSMPFGPWAVVAGSLLIGCLGIVVAAAYGWNLPRRKAGKQPESVVVHDPIRGRVVVVVKGIDSDMNRSGGSEGGTE